MTNEKLFPSDPIPDWKNLKKSYYPRERILKKYNVIKKRQLFSSVLKKIQLSFFIYKNKKTKGEVYYESKNL